jgi:hypothetical protein
MSKILFNDLTNARELDASSMAAISGGLWNLWTPSGPLSQSVYKTQKQPTGTSGDGINILSSDPTRSNVAYDSPFTPIPA